ncbi:MAG: FG-GAP-like repeat-containing protein, partial [Acidobacteriota bacterium]
MAEVSGADEVPFAAYATLETSYTNPKLTSADLDGDGDLDLLASSGEDDAVTWFENTAGDGSAWTAHTLDSTSRDPRGIVAGDLDGDGDVDVAVAAFEDNAVRWYQNDPSLAVCGSEFCVGTVISLLGLNEMAVGDLDLDGDLDLVVTSETDERVIWLDNSVGDASTWSFQAFETQLGGASEVALADLDRDGDLDIVAQGRLPSAAGLVWLENSFPVLGSCAEAFCAQTLD